MSKPNFVAGKKNPIAGIHAKEIYEIADFFDQKFILFRGLEGITGEKHFPAFFLSRKSHRKYKE